MSRASRRILPNGSYKYVKKCIGEEVAYDLVHLTGAQREEMLKKMIKDPPLPSKISGTSIAEILGVMVGAEAFEPNLQILDLPLSSCSESTTYQWYADKVPTHQLEMPPASVRIKWHTSDDPA